MPEDLKLSQIGSSLLPPPFRGLHSPWLRKHCQIILACYFGKSSIQAGSCTASFKRVERKNFLWFHIMWHCEGREQVNMHVPFSTQDHLLFSLFQGPHIRGASSTILWLRRWGWQDVKLCSWSLRFELPSFQTPVWCLNHLATPHLTSLDYIPEQGHCLLGMVVFIGLWRAG